MKPLEPLLPGETRSEYLRRVDSPMGRARALVEAHISDYGMVPHPDKIKDAVAAEIRGAADRSRQWQPIDTAPKDGTEILVWRPFAKGDLNPRPAEARTDCWRGGGWYRSFPAQQPTHWMPLPSPPRPFYGAECPSYPDCKGGCGLGCTHEIETRKRDGEAGMAWWNGLSDDEREQWAVRAGNTGRASDAWEAYKRQKAGG